MPGNAFLLLRFFIFVSVLTTFVHFRTIANLQVQALSVWERRKAGLGYLKNLQTVFVYHTSAVSDEPYYGCICTVVLNSASGVREN